MKDIEKYTKIYDGSGRREFFLKEDGILSFVEESYNGGACSCTECIVKSEAISGALDNEALRGTTFTGRMSMLFGNYDGLERFQQFCGNNNIDTMTLIWD